MANAFQDDKGSFLNPKDFTDEVHRISGKNLYELMAEALEFERQNMLINNNSKEYLKILVPVFNKYAHPAPVKTEATNPLDEKTMSELQEIYDNLLTRAALSTKPSSDKISQESQDKEKKDV